MWQHSIDAHNGEQGENVLKDYKFTVLDTFDNVTRRLTDEAVRIQNTVNNHTLGLQINMNTKREFFGSTMVSLLPTKGDRFINRISPDIFNNPVTTSQTSQNNKNQNQTTTTSQQSTKQNNQDQAQIFLNNLRPTIIEIQNNTNQQQGVNIPNLETHQSKDCQVNLTNVSLNTKRCYVNLNKINTEDYQRDTTKDKQKPDQQPTTPYNQNGRPPDTRVTRSTTRKRLFESRIRTRSRARSYQQSVD